MVIRKEWNICKALNLVTGSLLIGAQWMSVPLLLLKLLSLSLLHTPLKWEGSLYLNVNCLKSGCSSLAKGKQIKEMCLQPRPITLKFFWSRLTDIKCISYRMYTYTFVCVCKMYIDYNESFTKQYSSIYHKQRTYLFFCSNLFHFFKNTVWPSKIISQTTKEDSAVWKHTPPGWC